MKKEALLMLVAGMVLGAVLAFIGTRQYYLSKGAQEPVAAQAPAGPPPAGGQEAPAGGKPNYDPAQHTAMVAQIQAEIDKDPQNTAQRAMLGNIYYDAGKWGEAVPYYEKVLQLKPDETDVAVDLGVCYRNLKRYDDALAMFDRALKADPSKKQAIFNKAVVYGFDKNDKKKAGEVLKELQAKYPNDPMVKQLADELGKS